jgi:hypothetical protein
MPPVNVPRQSKLLDMARKRLVPLCAAVAVFAAIVPIVRAFYSIDVEYNEGWNVYNVSALAQHHALYPVKYGWTTVNYPMLSFSFLAGLHRFTGDYLFTARVVSLLSLLVCSLLVASIVRALKGSTQAATLAGLFCFACFCANANEYVGMDDPQLFAQCFFLSALFIYIRFARDAVRAGRGTLPLAATALLCVLGGFTKHNLLEFPLTVLVDLALFSLTEALCFTLYGALLTVLGIALNIRAGGPYFLSQLLAPRGYSPLHILGNVVNVVGPLLFPFCMAAYMAMRLRRDADRRVAALLLLLAIVLGGIFSGGNGVSINALFGVMLATSILLGLFFDRAASPQAQPGLKPGLRRTLPYIPAVVFLWLFIPLLISGNWNPVAVLREDAAEQQRFAQEVALLHSRPGPAICESLLLCFDAGKPYLYDPFNATRLIEFHKLDQTVLLDQLRQHKFGAVQLSALPRNCEDCAERFTPEVLEAIQENYTPTLEMKNAVILLPRQNIHVAGGSSPPLPTR